MHAKQRIMKPPKRFQYVSSSHHRIMAKTHLPTYSCNECQKEFTSIHYLKIHMNNVHVHEGSNSVFSADDEMDPLEFIKVELHEGKGGK